jgi:hypothetical protein
MNVEDVITTARTRLPWSEIFRRARPAAETRHARPRLPPRRFIRLASDRSTRDAMTATQRRLRRQRQGS